MIDAGRFWAKVDRSAGPDACWPWTGCRHEKGYGQVSVDGRTARTHRVAYALEVGPIPDGLHVMHSCDNPPCCNPRHLRAGTNAENHADKAAKGRANNARGEAIPRSKITEVDVLEIRRLHSAGSNYSALGRQFGMSANGIKAVVTGSTWGHIKETT